MKKIDLHIHTVVSPSDRHFDFCIEKLKQYVIESNLDAIAITNHNLFDIKQFIQITATLDIPVFPGIEIDLEKGHILMIADPSDLDSFDEKARRISDLIPDEKTYITIAQFREVYGSFDNYLLIPHYAKRPSIPSFVIEELKDHIHSGEVDSLKKFIRTHKDETQLTPVLFSDQRIDINLEQFSLRNTYIDCGEISLSSIKNALKDRSKVTLSSSDGNKLFEVFDDGQMLSTGLNILLGDRSSGKTVTLDKIYKTQNAKYIKQFALVQQDEDEYKKEFEKSISRKRGHFTDEFLLGFKRVTEEVSKINLNLNFDLIESYLSSLKASAEHLDKNDSFSKTRIFNETPFEIGTNKTLEDLINSTLQLIENIDYRYIITKHLDLSNLNA